MKVVHETNRTVVSSRSLMMPVVVKAVPGAGELIAGMANGIEGKDKAYPNPKVKYMTTGKERAEQNG